MFLYFALISDEESKPGSKITYIDMFVNLI